MGGITRREASRRAAAVARAAIDRQFSIHQSYPIRKTISTGFSDFGQAISGALDELNGPAVAGRQVGSTRAL